VLERLGIAVHTPGAIMTTPAAITSLITDRPLCVTCISAKAGVSEDEAKAVLLTLAASVVVVTASRRCPECELVRETFTVSTRE
jgi:hypothetical protein